MTSDSSGVGPWRARANRWRWRWSRTMGWPGLLGMALCTTAAVLAWGVRPAIATSRVEMLRAHVARLDAATRQAPAASDAAARDPRDAVRDSLPSVTQRGRVIGELLVLLGKGGVSADQAEYSAEDLEPGLVRLRVVLPVEGAYGPTRRLVGDILNAMPYAALDAIELERSSATAASLSGRLRFSLFFRREAP